MNLHITHIFSCFFTQFYQLSMLVTVGKRAKRERARVRDDRSTDKQINNKLLNIGINPISTG